MCFGFLLASSALDGKVLLWQPTNRRGAQVGEFQFAGGEASAVAWAPDDKTLAAGCGTGAVGVFRLSPARIENNIIVTRALSGDSDRAEIKLKPADYADYLIYNALR